MAGLDPNVLMTYPEVLRDKDWQKKKGLLAKLVKTGLQAELKKGEALHAKLDTSNLYPSRNAPKSISDLDEGLKSAKAYHASHVQPLSVQLRVIEAAAKKAEVALTKAKCSDAAKAAAAIAKAADFYAVTCRSLDYEPDYKKGVERVAKLNELAAKLLKGSIKKFLVSTSTYVKGDGSMASWDDLVKQNGRSVSNSVKQLANYNAQFWNKFKMFQGFDLTTMKLHGDEELTKKKRAVVVKEAIKQVLLMDAFEA